MAAEVTINYVITDVEKNRKFVCVDPHDIPIVAIVDPDMSASMPTGLFAHLPDGCLCSRRRRLHYKRCIGNSPICFHLKAIEIIGRSLRSAVAGDFTGREAMSLGQYIAGRASPTQVFGIVHSMAHPLSAVYDIPHGRCHAVNSSLEIQRPATGEKYREIARVMGVPDVDGMDQETYRQAAIDVIQNQLMMQAFLNH